MRARSLPRRRRLLRLVFLAIVIGLAWLAIALFEPFKGSGHGLVAITIPQHSGVSKIADLLARRGVVGSGFLFEVRVTLAGHRGDLKPGAYTLKRDMSYGSAIDALVAGPGSNLVSLTIPEGRSRREIQRLIAPDGLTGSYLAATVHSPPLDPGRYGAARARDLEGFLFPSTYQLRRGAPVGALVARQLNAFKRAFRTVDLRAARRVNLTAFDVLTIASLIEREAEVPRERALIASVIYNRLHFHMPLGIDATIRFATGNWTQPLTNAQLHIRSPYNTRTNVGLPPGPIGNPGLASIRAAAHPKRTRFLYYVVKPGTCGEHAFSRNNAQFQRDVARYNKARAANGGRSPTRCPG